MDSQFGVVDKRFLARSLGLLNPPTPIIVKEYTSVEKAVTLLKEHKIGGVVIVNSQGKITGMFTERDVVTKVVLTGLSCEETEISQVMTRDPHTATMTTTVAFALNMMSQGGYRHIPIVDEESYPVGMISVKNIVDYIASALTKDLHQFAV